MLKTIKQPYKKVTNLDKDQTNRYSDKFVNTSKCFDSTQYLQAKAKETLNKIKQSIIHQNLSKNKDDLENLVRYFKNKLKFNKDNLDLTIGLGNCLEKLQKPYIFFTTLGVSRTLKMSPNASKRSLTWLKKAPRWPRWNQDGEVGAKIEPTRH